MEYVGRTAVPQQPCGQADELSAVLAGVWREREDFRQDQEQDAADDP